ncbi:MAG TPA: hypothetical protein VFQ41_13855, partial [Candidatus Angelobacter sp.]|nr:hypothetical protein [Candidatus Angelobacter sp.]
YAYTINLSDGTSMPFQFKLNLQRNQKGGRHGPFPLLRKPGNVFSQESHNSRAKAAGIFGGLIFANKW